MVLMDGCRRCRKTRTTLAFLVQTSEYLVAPSRKMEEKCLGGRKSRVFPQKMFVELENHNIGHIR